MPRAKATPVKASGTAARKGPKPVKVFVNIQLKKSTRDAMNVLCRKHGFSQGELLDELFRKATPRKARA
jgi:hypothetical protein